jgi:hypothetical protein
MAAFCDPQNPADQWHWSEHEGLPFLTCELLAAWSHGFFTQHFDPQTPEAIVQGLDRAASVHRVRQVHGNVALTPSAIATHPDLPPADAVVTEHAQQSAWVASADCTPALIGDVATGRVAAIHSGWRGTAQRIVPGTIGQLLNLGSELGNLRVALGPAIQGEVYQVGEQVGAEVARSVVAQPDPDVDYLQRLMTGDRPAILPDDQPGRVRLDVRQVIAHQLADLGFREEQVAIAPCCTYQQPDYFFSYRRTKAKKVQWSVIVSL